MRLFFILISMIMSLNVMADYTNDSFSYTGNSEQEFRRLEKDIFQTTWQDVQVPSTCTRQVPYPHEVCNYQTRYRQECYQVPYSRQVCNIETRYRQQCRTVTEQVCSRQPVCQVVNGRRICHDQQVCRPMTRQVCQQIPVQERVCRNVTDYRQECRQVPYQDRVCYTETRYRDEQYSCTRTERREVRELVGKVEASLQFEFRKDPALQGINSMVSLNLYDYTVEVAAENLPGASRTVFVAKEERRDSRNGSTTNIDLKYQVSVLDEARFYSPVQSPAVMADRTYNGELVMDFGKVYYLHTFGLKLKVTGQNGQVYLDRELTAQDYQLTGHPSQPERSQVLLNLSTLLEGRAQTGEQLQVEVETKLKMEGRRILARGALPPTMQFSRDFVLFE
jgi:hypothetical protein